MKKHSMLAILFLFAITGARLDSLSLASPADSYPAAQEKSAEQVYRNIQALKGVPAGELRGLAAAPDGKTLYYVHASQVWEVPTDGSRPPRLQRWD